MMQNSKLIFFLTALIFLSFTVLISAADKPKKKAFPWNLSLSLSSYYDSNILKNSDEYIERFKNNEDEGRFHINRYDDLVMDYDLRFAYSHKLIKNLNSIFTASADYSSYSFNTIKSWSSYSFSLQQFLAAPTSIMFSYSYIPDFYVKHYRDNDWVQVLGVTPETFQPYSFSKNEFSVWLQHSFLSDTRARFYFSYMSYYHNEHFTEYDCDNLLYGFRVFHDFNKKISADAGYRFISSDAKGFDEPGESKGSSDDADASNNEHLFSAGITFQMPPVFKLDNTLQLSGQYSRRNYTTPVSRTLDVYHAGRSDNSYNLEIDYSIAVLRNFSISAFFNYVTRITETSIDQNQAFLTAEKDFSQNLIGLNFNYTFTF
jgi:hypothetical protein